MAFILNGDSHDIPPDWADEPLLFLLREHFGLTGAKFGCGVGICGACDAPDGRRLCVDGPFLDAADSQKQSLTA